MGLVDDDGKFAGPQNTNFIQYERKLLDSGDNNPLAVFQRFAQFLTAFSNCLDYTFDLRKILDVFPNLLVQAAPVRDDDDGVKNVFVLVVVQFGELMGQPSD